MTYHANRTFVSETDAKGFYRHMKHPNELEASFRKRGLSFGYSPTICLPMSSSARNPRGSSLR